MQIELNRRTFLAALGATGAFMAAGPASKRERKAVHRSLVPLYFPAEHPMTPPFRPKSEAITYLPS
ncbi:MAG: twin-arginine translocation signal domain-containing protein [Pontiella sp.]|nr:twin-arginine translocation signal domain-containing protein [Pontiella sp.]